jgi:hypothetical protein
MEYTEIVQDCYSVTVDSRTQEHKIETSVNTAGELPHTAIFVFSIGDPARTSSDAYSRVANPQDLKNLTMNREDAIVAGRTEYLASYVELKYADLDVAVQAKAMLRTRINDLIKSWLTYRDSFTLDTGQNILFPSSDPEVEAALVAVYKEAKQDRIEAEDNVTTAEAAVDLSRSEVTAAQDTHTIYKTFLDYHIRMQSEVDAYKGLLTVEGTPAANYWGTTLGPTLTNERNTLVGQELSSRQLITSKQRAMDSAVQDKAQADQELIAAQAAENAALAAVLAVLPTFDSTSV